MTEMILQNKLESSKQTSDRLIQFLADSNLDGNCSELIRICNTKEGWGKITEVNRQLQKVKQELAGVCQIIADPVEDPELKELAIAEIAELETKISRLTQQQNILLLPSDPLAKKSVFLEIVADSDCDESHMWATSLARMYSLYGETQNWQVILLMEDLGDRNGFKRVMFGIEGDDVYGKLKWETGIHQLQKDYLASATVKVIPQVDSNEMPILPEEIIVYDRRSTDCRCNLCVCKTNYGVQVFHQQTGIRITCTEERSFAQNRDRAMQILRAKLYDIKLAERQKEVLGLRRSQIGTGVHSEKIRIYNYKDNRIIDCRLQQNFPLADCLDGNMEAIVRSCISQQQQQQLEELANSLYTAKTLN